MEKEFTIQNVPIKLERLRTNTDTGMYLQYKMFLLNFACDKANSPEMFKFTIQNVSIK